MGFFGLFGEKKKKRASPARPRAKAKKKVVESDVKFAHIMKEFGVLQKELKDVKQALGLLRQAEERTLAEVQDHPIKMGALIEREVGELSRKMDEIVLKAGRDVPDAPKPKGAKVTPLMRSVLDILEAGAMQSGDIYRRLLDMEVRVHEKSVPRALKGLIGQGLVRVNSDSGGYRYEKVAE